MIKKINNLIGLLQDFLEGKAENALNNFEQVNQKIISIHFPSGVL
jgi:hypothetical protein